MSFSPVGGGMVSTSIHPTGANTWIYQSYWGRCGFSLKAGGMAIVSIVH